MDGIDDWLQRLSWIALISLPLLLAWGAYFASRRLRIYEEDRGEAWQESQTSRLIEILRLVDQQGGREARTTVLIDVRGREQKGENWWESDDRLHRAAEQVCASYDYVGGIINFDETGRVGQFFLETWGEDILRVHHILERYLDFRRKSGAAAYNEFTWLAGEAKLIHRSPPPAEPEHPIRTVIRHLQS